MLTEKLWHMAQIGAEWVLYLLLILSVVSIAIMIERAIYFWRAKADLETMRLLLRKSLERGGPQHAKKRFEGDTGVPAVILCEALDAASDGADAAEERAIGVRGKQKFRLEKGLVFLGTLGNNAPFVGLFGTVLGIINAFRDLSGAQMQTMGTKIMGSISEALVATAVGLLVALPAVVAFNYFQRKVKEVLTESDVLLHDLLSYLKGQKAQEPTFSQPEMASAQSLRSVSSLSIQGLPAKGANEH